MEVGEGYLTSHPTKVCSISHDGGSSGNHDTYIHIIPLEGRSALTHQVPMTTLPHVD